jgi:hypothetical protein
MLIKIGIYGKKQMKKLRTYKEGYTIKKKFKKILDIQKIKWYNKYIKKRKKVGGYDR